MNSIAKMLVKGRYVLLILFLVFTGASVFLMQKTNIISDFTKYLPDSSQMSQGVVIMNGEFGETNSKTASLKVMFSNLNEDEKPGIKEALSKLEYVESVDYEAGSSSYNKDKYTLYILTVDKQDNVSFVEGKVKDLYGNKDYIARNINMNGGIPTPMVAFLLAVVLTIMLVMCGSYLEPFLFLVTIGIAILLNFGTNAFLPRVSSMTNGIAAVLQLVLSMDYSIILSNRYRQACKKNDDHVVAMTVALKESIISVLSSAVTTIVGLLSLMFMSFKIGGDLGFVLAKGVFLSLVCVFTVLPAFLLLFDKIILKTAKNTITIPMQKLAVFSYNKRMFIVIVFGVLFIVSFIGKNFAGIQYDMPEENEITEIFPAKTQVVLLYKNSDEEKMPKLIDTIESYEGVDSVQAYANTLGQAYSADEIAGMMAGSGIDESVAKLLVYDRTADRSKEAMTIEQLVGFIGTLVENPVFAGQIDGNMQEQLGNYSFLCSKQTLTTPMDSATMAGLMNIDQKMLAGLFMLSKTDKMSIADFINVVTNEAIKSMIESQGMDTSSIAAMSSIVSMVVDEKQLTLADAEQLVSELDAGIPAGYMNLLYEFYFSSVNYDENQKLTIEELFDTLETSETLALVIPENELAGIVSAKTQILEGKAQLVGKEYSRAIITVTSVAGSPEMMDLIGKITDTTKNELSVRYLIGNSVMAYEMESSFDSELNKITLITALAIFIVIAISFKSIAVPLILVLVIQAAVYMTMSIMGIVNYDMNYLALLIMQCILMGATVDYAIVFTNYYREKRETSDVRESLSRAYQSSIRTILTSGLIMVVTTGVLGLTSSDPTLAPIIRIIAAGVISALILIILFLPGLLAVLDRFVVPKKRA